MKKSLFFVAAASALMLTACSSENDVVQSPTNQNTATVQQQAVGFDVYTPAATNVTRAGLEGTMTTSRLQRSENEGGGFGVYAYLTEDGVAAAGDGANATAYASGNGTTANIPNFMVNQKILWDTESMGWYYNPIKYWPNETDNDSQTPAAGMEDITAGKKHLDRLTFFAYAPYVSAGKDEVGITGITTKDGELTPAYSGVTSKPKDPSVSYEAELDNPNKVVDLLWGVAPSGGMNYTAVNGTTVTKSEGLPLIDMTKPDVNTSMKFLFQHALARIGITAVAAIDQVSPGGTLDPNTRITIEKITLKGKFGNLGILNLNNNMAGNTHKNVANWTRINATEVDGAHDISGYRTITITKPYIAEHLRYIDDVESKHQPQTNRVGVTTVRQNVIAPSAPSGETGYSTFWSTQKTYTEAVPYSESTPFYSTEACTSKSSATITPPTSPAKLFTISSLGVYTVRDKTSLTYPEVNEFYVATFKEVVADEIDAGDYDETTMIKLTPAKGKLAYVKTAAVAGPPATPEYYTPQIVGKDPVVGQFVLAGDATKATATYAAGPYWTRDANYFMVVPTDNILAYNNLTDKEIKDLHTVTVKIEYYITTEDAALNDGRAQTKNVVEKEVVFPSIANGKSYNLNLILGLTSVKMEAEVDDWKVVTVNGNLPQNTSGE